MFTKEEPVFIKYNAKELETYQYAIDFYHQKLPNTHVSRARERFENELKHSPTMVS